MMEWGFGDIEEPQYKSGWAWLDIRGTKIRSIRIIGEDVMAYKAHWSSGKMRMCGGYGCPLCEAGLNWQRRFILAVKDLKNNRNYLWEIGGATARKVAESTEWYGAIAGITYQVARQSESVNSRLVLEEVGFMELKKEEQINKEIMLKIIEELLGLPSGTSLIHSEY